MSVRREITEYDGVYFITFTCCRWLHLFEEGKCYDVVYKWFDYLKSKGHFITGYVPIAIGMPNHVHTLIGFRNTQGQSINSIVGNGKRFKAYEMVKRLKELNKEDILKLLSTYVNGKEKLKDCRSDKFIEQKLNYIHENPCRGNWDLVKQPEDYVHSSAGYYGTGKQGGYEVISYMELEDVDLTKAGIE